MILKSIEMKGFKSFPQKTLLEFPDGVISIIGPNGSGKSNVLDAVRWVLGEKSAKNLRGEKMEDIIFSGTKIHKSMNFCEVEIIFGNEDRFLDIDFTEVAIKRKAYRNGESKFYINGTVCRQKDIKELLLDSGIGKEGYSIISQGRIDEIVNSNPLQRRKIFEEASKISKNRYQKEESQKKLENVKENLERINDIYFEIEKQVKPLKIQSENAQKYLELREELIKSDVNRIMSELEETTAEVVKIKAFLDEKNEKIVSIDNILYEYTQNLCNEELKLQDLENRTYEKSDHKNEALMKLTNIKNKYEISENTIKTGKEQLNKTEEIRRHSQDKVEVADNNFREKLKSANDLEKKIAQLESVIEEMHSITKSYEGELQLAETNVENVSKEINEISNKINILESKKMSIEDVESKDSQKEISLVEEETKQLVIINDLKLILDNKQKDYKTICVEIDSLKKHQKDIIDKIAIEQVNLSKLSDSIVSTGSLIKELTSKRSLFEDMEKHYEGMSNSVKFVLKSPQLNGVVDAVGNLISVDEEYERAIESALGGSIQNIVTITSEDAKKAIDLLKKNKQGRATFLPIDTVKGSKLDLKNEVIASDLVSCDNKYKDIITQLLGRTIVVDTMDDGIATAKKYNQKYRIVTKGGEIFNTGGGITGGAFVKVANILSRKREIEDITNKIDQLKIEQLENETLKKDKYLLLQSDISESNRIKIKLESYIEKESGIKIDMNSLENKLVYENTILANIKEGQEERAKLNAANKDELSSIVDEINNAKDSMRKTNEELSLATKNRELSYIKLNEQKETYNKKREEFFALKGEFSSTEVMIEQSKEMLEQLKEQVLMSDKSYEEILESMELAKSEISTLRAQITEQEQLFQEELKNEEAARREFAEQKAKVEKLKLNEKNMQTEKFVLVEEKYQIENRYTRLENIVNNANAKMEEEYQLTFEEALNLKSDEVNQSKSHISKLKSQISALGNINIDSINEYEKVNERYTLFLTQKTDLELSLEELSKINTDIEKVMKSEFKKEFQKINDLFKITFKELFGGGEGELILSDEDDILNCEIEIHAQPPGKKLKGISVMSGGEKALTAIAILFAILMTRPTPFCFLDEIDAPLDDVNIYRYNRYIKGLAKDTQFITITHRRGTMEESDYIYGVTMEDKGVSKVVSLKLEDADNYVDN